MQVQRRKHFSEDRIKSSPAFTLIECFGFIIAIVAVFVGVAVGYRYFGTFGAVVGGAIGIAAFIGFGFALAFLWDLWVKGYPPIPECKKGCCSSGSYGVERVGDEFCYRCQTGDRYTRIGKRFVFIDSSGVKHPYLIWRPFRGWFPDESIDENTRANQ